MTIDIPSLPPNTALDTGLLMLPTHELSATQVQSGPATVGLLPLGRLCGLDIGLWQLSPSTSTDVESDELFVVLSGEATVQFADGTPPLHLRAGVLARLATGTRTTWTVRAALRKLYLQPPSS